MVKQYSAVEIFHSNSRSQSKLHQIRLDVPNECESKGHKAC